MYIIFPMCSQVQVFVKYVLYIILNHLLDEQFHDHVVNVIKELKKS